MRAARNTVYRYASLFLLVSLRVNAQTLVTDTFYFTGFTQTFVIPSCVSEITLCLEGAMGATGQNGYPGGYGGKATVVITPTPGTVLSLNIGGAGTATTGGWNGGGDGGQGLFTYGGGGGGSTDLRIGGNSLAHRVAVVAGGGGGGGGSWNHCAGGSAGGSWPYPAWVPPNAVTGLCQGFMGFGGEGGNLGGLASCQGGTVSNAPAGKITTMHVMGGGGGGLQGGGGICSYGTGAYGSAGSLFKGGNGGNALYSYGGNGIANCPWIGAWGGGGGGGGLYGGGGGMAGQFTSIKYDKYAGGGGAGSSYFDTSRVRLSRVHMYGGAATGSGIAYLYYHPASGSSFSVQSSALAVCPGQSLQLQASGGSTYFWPPVNTFSGSGSSSIVVWPTQATDYTVVTGAGTACMSTSIISIEVSQTSFQPTLTAWPSTAVCAGGTVALSASGVPCYTLSGGLQSGVPFTPTASAVYTVTGDDGLGGCPVTATLLVTVSTCTTGGNRMARPVIMPNPSNGTFAIDAEANTTLKVFDSMGNVLREFAAGTEPVRHSIEGLGPGAYLVVSERQGQIARSTAIVR